MEQTGSPTMYIECFFPLFLVRIYYMDQLHKRWELQLSIAWVLLLLQNILVSLVTAKFKV